MRRFGFKKRPPPSTIPAEKRIGLDRRKRPTPIFSRYTFFGRRGAVRREEDRSRYVYVDRYSVWLFLLILAIVVLGTADAFLTLYHVHVHNAVEANPIMRYFLGKGPNIFFNIKYILTAVCLMVLCLHKNLAVVRILLVLILVMYLLITINHVYLLLMVS